jgi:hypothetical protein
MKLFSRILLLLYFGITVILISIGSVVEFIKEYYPIIKSEIISFAKARYRSYSRSPYGGLSVV